MKNIILLFFIAVTVLTSCIQDEAPNSEADILTCSIDDSSILLRDPIIQNDKIAIMVASNADLTKQTLNFTLTDGASVEPASGTTRDFTTPQTYTVTSEDKKWSKTYTISFVTDELANVYHFEDTIPETNNRYYIFVEKADEQITMVWASGNIGFAMTGSADSPDEYPTKQSSDGYSGKCACLTTLSTGSFGAMAGMPIAAGSLYIGTFDVLNAMSNPLKSTQFGLPFYHKPITFSGYYKYKSGDTYYENGKPTTEHKTDKCHFYAVLYETDDTLKTLDGTNVLTHPNIICSAIIEDQKETDEWTRFELPFVMRDGKSIDEDKLANGKYNLTVVFTSSIEGAVFSGAPGSTLYIDEAEISY